MSRRFALPALSAGVPLLLLAAPAAAQSQQDLIDRTIAVMQDLCGNTGDATLANESCVIGFAGGAQQDQNALTVSPREQTGASSTATQTTDSQVEAEKERLERARSEDPDSDAGRLGVFATLNGGFGEVDDRGEAEGYDVHGAGFNVGVDYRLADSLVAGLGFGWNRNNTEFDAVAAANGSGARVGGGEIDTYAYSGSLYGSFFEGPFHLDGVFTYTYVDYESERPVVLLEIGTPLALKAKGDTHANQVGVSFGGGYDFEWEALAIGPTAQLNYRGTWIDDYKERGVPGFPLDYDDQEIHSLVTSVGGEASYAISTPIGVVIPHLRGSYEHEFENDERDIDARLFLNDNPGALDVLTSRTSSPDRDYGRVGGGVSAQFPGGVAAFVDYEALVGLSDVEYHLFTLGGRIAF